MTAGSAIAEYPAEALLADRGPALLPPADDRSANRAAPRPPSSFGEILSVVLHRRSAIASFADTTSARRSET